MNLRPDQRSFISSLPTREFLRAFPFYFVWNDHDVILEVGPSLPKFCPEAVPGARLQDVFISKRTGGEFSHALASANQEHLMLLEDRVNHHVLRGQVIMIESHSLGAMLGSPWFTEPNEVAASGLTMSDFAIHDQTIDHLHLLQTQRMAADDLQRLNQRLIQQRTQLRDQEAHLRKLALVAARTDNAVVVTDAMGRIEWVNEGFTRITGWLLDEVLGRTPGSFLQGPESDPATIAYMRQCICDHKSFRTEVLNYHRSGAKYWTALEVQPIRNDAGEVTNFMAIESDVTQQKRSAQELLEAKESAESASRAKSDFLATMSHEIRTPMNGIIGMSSLLLDTHLEPKQREMVEAVRHSGDALMTIIEDILDFSKIEARKLDLVEEVFRLDAVIRGVVDLLHHKAAARRIDLVVNIAPDVPPSLIGDPGRLRQILMNLVGNGIKFTDEGSITVEVRCLEAPSSGSVTLEISVKDTGIGMTQEQQAQLFQAFTQVDSSSKRRFGGAGLGLAISKRLVELMGGQIGVESERFLGSRFWLRLPLRVALTQETPPSEGEPAETADVSSQPSDGVKPRVLVVEDNEVNARMAILMLEKHGYPAEVARDGEEAVDRFTSGVYDGILMDCHMPHMDGYEATRAIREIEASAFWQRPRCRIIAMTANVMAGERERCLEAGMDDYVSKPLRAKPLTEALGRILPPSE